MEKQLYYEDFTIGQQLRSRGTYTIGKESALSFAKEYDPQSQHLDQEWAKDSPFGEIIVSGWQTAAATMHLKTQTDLFYVAGGLLGMGIEELRWPRPVMPDDTLRIVVTVIDKRISKSRPDKGIMKYKVETFNQRDELVMSMIPAVIVPVREPARLKA